MNRKIAVVVLVVIAAAVAIGYAPVRASVTRSAARRHVAQAEALVKKSANPVVQQTLRGAADDLKFALMRRDASREDIAARDDALVAVMKEMESSPPPERPVYLTAEYDTTVRPGSPFHVRVSIHADVPAAYVVSVMSELSVGGWASGVVSRRVNRELGATPIDVDLEFTIPTDVAGSGRLRVSAAYRLNPTGEGQDFQALPKTPLPEVTVAR